MRFFPRITIALLTAAVAAAAGCDRGSPAAQPQSQRPGAPPVDVSVDRSTIGSVERTIDVVGSLFGDEDAQISAKVAGQIVEVHKDVGDEAAPGEPLAQIDPVTYRLLRDQARMSLQQSLATLGLKQVPEGDEISIEQLPAVVQKRLEADNARRRYERAQQLFSGTSGSISEQEYTDLRTAAEIASAGYDVQLLEVQSQLADVRVREAELRIREQRLEDTTVRAPGVIGTTQPSSARRYLVAARQVSLGEFMREGTPMFRVVADDPIKYRASVPERYLADMRVGQPVRLRVEGRPQTFTGRISRLNPQIDATSRTFQIEAMFDNPDGLLRPGQFARAAVVIGSDPNVTLVPVEAVVAFAGVVRVFSVNDGKAIEHRVTLGQRVGERVEIVEGFSGEADVVVRGGTRLIDGMAVNVAAPTAPATRPSR